MALSVTVLSGFLGSGKTSLLKHILQNRAGLRCAVIVNEITDENIDSYAMGGTALLRGEEKMVEMANGCICCTLRKDLLVQLRELAAAAKYDCVVIESSGISEPMHVAETFMTDLNDGQGPLEKVARLDTCVTVVDASEVRGYLQGRIQRAVTTQQKEGSYSASEVDADGNTRNIAQLLVEQLEFANVIVLNKTDRIDRRSVAEIVELIRVVNPTAKILPTVHSVVPRLSDILITGAFTAEFAASIKGWMQEDPDQHNPETLEYGVSSVMFREQRPFHPGRLHAWISEYWGLSEMPPDDHQSEASSESSDSEEGEEGVAAPTATTAMPTEEFIRRRTERYGGDLFRVKGFMWVGNPSRLGYYVCVSAAGSTLSFLPGGGWGTFPARSGSGTTSVSPHQRLAIVGQYINKDRILADLAALLLTPAEEAELKRAMVSVVDTDAPPADIFDDPFEPFGQDGDEHQH